MTPTVEIEPLSQNKRRIVFILSVLLFVIAVPISVFYAIGYRFDFTNHVTNIKSVGGMYVRNDVPNTEMFVDNEPVHDMRMFQKAAYIQNLEAGMHRIHVQGAGVQTWVKELPVYAHFVTEVSSFNLPNVPQIRILTRWYDPATGKGILDAPATSTQFSFASTTNPLELSATTSTSSLVSNSEYTYVKSLFASSTELMALMAQQKKIAAQKFSFNLATSSAVGVTPTTTRQYRDFALYQNGDDVYIRYAGDMNKVPYYYCVTYDGPKKTATEYGTHVYDALVAETPTTTDLSTLLGQRVCRTSIRIDRLNQKVQWFDFFPNSSDLVLMQLEDGLYAVEVDDRAWQNAQRIYPGKNIHVIEDGGRIYIQDGDYYLEVFTEIAS